MNVARSVAFALFFVSTTAYAAADLSVTIAPPTGTAVYQTARYWVNVKNVGNLTSQGGSLRIDLPRTHTSPQVYVMGTLGAKTGTCTLAGTRITCPVPSTKKNVTRGFYFDLAVPQNEGPLAFSAEIVPTQTNDLAANNVANSAPSYTNPSWPIVGTVDVLNSHCTGTGLTSYFECTLFPSSIATHVTTLEDGGAVLFDVGVPASYTGTWSQPAANRLAFTYYEDNIEVASFDGYSVGNGCFEGVTHFPNSTYVSPYSVCITP
jgi:hypothetical protein